MIEVFLAEFKGAFSPEQSFGRTGLPKLEAVEELETVMLRRTEQQRQAALSFRLDEQLPSFRRVVALRQHDSRNYRQSQSTAKSRIESCQQTASRCKTRQFETNKVNFSEKNGFKILISELMDRKRSPLC
jgi:hypothetical protein